MGCGKTTIGRLLSTRLGWRFEDGDDYHPPANISKMKAGLPLCDEDRYPWLQILRSMIDAQLADKEKGPMILACSALKRSYRKLLGIDQQSVVSVYLQGSAALLQERIEARTHRFMAKGLLESQLRTLEEPRSGIRVSIDQSPEEIVEAIISEINKLNLKTEDTP